MITNEELMMPLVVDIQTNLELDHAASNVSALWILHSRKIVAAGGPLVTISTDSIAISAMWTITVLTSESYVASWRLNNEAMTNDAWPIGKESNADNGNAFHHATGPFKVLKRSCDLEGIQNHAS